MKPRKEVTPGQAWRSRDYRDDGRRVDVLKVDKQHVYCRSYPRWGNPRRVRVRLDRFHSSYEFVS